ncbi:MAG: HD domain-containing protein [Caldilineaceae bacterium]|nr:HD domain-containing protein [Caldilineaceae bacterium]
MIAIADERLARQIQFLLEIDGLKQVLRRSLILGSARRENSAEHSWHLAMLALILHEHANEPVDLLYTIKLLLIHDIVELDAGDTFAYDFEAGKSKAEREQDAAQRIFGLLPTDQAGELRALWEEYEGMQSAESRFANALDRLMPMFHNLADGGTTWQTGGVRPQFVADRAAAIGEGSAALATLAGEILRQAQANGLFGEAS